MSLRHIYLPARSAQPGKIPDPGDLGDGQVAVNFADRRLWVGVPSEMNPFEMIEVTSIGQLLDIWQDTVQRHTPPRDRIRYWRPPKD